MARLQGSTGRTVYGGRCQAGDISVSRRQCRVLWPGACNYPREMVQQRHSDHCQFSLTAGYSCVYQPMLRGSAVWTRPAGVCRTHPDFANFRSRPDILAYINRCFEAPLSGPGQPGYVALTPTLPTTSHDLPCVAKIKLDLPSDPRPEDIRDTEAAAVADLCARLIGNLTIREADGTTATRSEEHTPELT